MTISDVMKTATLEDFYCLKSLGFLAASTTYDEFLAMKEEAEDAARKVAWEAALREVRARMAAEQETGAAVHAA